MAEGALRTGRLVFRLSGRELWRNPLGLVLLAVIPAVFVGMIVFTAGEKGLPLKMFFGDEAEIRWLTQRQVGLIFVSAAVSGFLAAYYALILFHGDLDYFRMCVFMGLDPVVFGLARFAAFLCVTAILAALTTLGIGQLTELYQPWGVFAGFFLVTVVYGAYGGLVGALSRNFMTSLLLIVLLADLDAAWLQNPVYYTAAQESEVIRWLPAYYPCQLVFSSAFTMRANLGALAGAGTWAVAMVCLLLVALRLRLRVLPPGGASGEA